MNHRNRTRLFAITVGAGVAAITAFVLRGLGPELLRYVKMRRM